MPAILVVNSGSSSVKFQVFDIGDGENPVRLVKGRIEGIGVRPRLIATGANTGSVEQSFDSSKVPDVPSALEIASGWLRQKYNLDPIAIGHRVVHGGPRYNAPVVVDEKVLADLRSYVPLAPLHQPNNLAPISFIMGQRPSLPQVACFDTAFHRGHDERAKRYAIPEALHREGIQRYGFHGLSYEYIAMRLRDVEPAIAHGKIIVAHLGSGASMCALENGKSIESTMGFTALDGLPMGTRPGQIDPGVILYLIDRKGMTPAQVTQMLYHDCGLKGLSGLSSDVRELQQSSDPRAKLALDHFVYRASLTAGLLTAALQGLDGFVFTAGIGENSPSMREGIMGRLAWLGAVVDPEANKEGGPCISSVDSRFPIYVIPTDEELMIAHHTIRVLGQRGTIEPKYGGFNDQGLQTVRRESTRKAAPE